MLFFILVNDTIGHFLHNEVVSFPGQIPEVANCVYNSEHNYNYKNNENRMYVGGIEDRTALSFAI